MAQIGEGKFNTLIQPTWCPGCGNYGIFEALKLALFELELEPHQVLVTYDIGCNSNGANFLKTYALHSLHGRALPPAEGAKLANKALTVIATAGDGGAYGEGLQHLIHAARYNLDITYLVANNQRFSLTLGQASPTSVWSDTTKTTPFGEIKLPLNPTLISLDAGASFVARGFAGEIGHLKDIIKRAVRHRGFAHVDILQPCVTFNELNTHEWFRKVIYKLEEHKYSSDSRERAREKALEFEKTGKLPVGVFYAEERKTYLDQLPQLKGEALTKRDFTGIDCFK